MDLIQLKDDLRKLPQAKRVSLDFTVDEIAAGYHQLRANAPHRTQGYLSESRAGIPSSGDSSNRAEEHLAMGLRNRRQLVLPDGGRLRLIDYQFPLQSARADAGIGRIDLLGLFEDGTLAVIELKMDGSAEDRRLGLLEALIYAAIVEANMDAIADEVLDKRGGHVARVRPRIALVAPPAFWSDPRAYPSLGDLRNFTNEITSKLPIEVALLCLNDATVEFGLNGREPSVTGHAFLSLGHGNLPSAARNGSPSHAAYLKDLFQSMWTYRKAYFAASDGVFEPNCVEGKQPPVFDGAHADRNLITPPEASPKVLQAIAGSIPREDRHRHFASMRSSQALAQSAFAGLKQTGNLGALAGLQAECGTPAFFDAASGYELKLERQISFLNEPRPTSVDAFFAGPRRVAVEVKFTEVEFGCCSRPELRSGDSAFSREHCDGTFTVQRDRKERCALSELGIRYWEFVPDIFEWSGSEDHRPCALRATYQLVRNILAACMRDDGVLDMDSGHALVVYDERNPAFAPGGAADLQWWTTVRALRYPRLLRRVSWQKIARHLARSRDLEWLTEGLREKYGIQGDGEGNE